MVLVMSESTDPLQYWGWIPHLNSSFEDEVSIFSFHERIRELFRSEVCGWIEVNVRDYQIDRIPEDIIFDGKIRMQFEISADFQYGVEEGLSCRIEAGDGKASLGLVVYRNGLIRLDIRGLEGPFQTFSKDDLRVIVREPYFFIGFSHEVPYSTS